ncbi:hypothetical protein ZIOFF_057766 [Zingiber officinale]|uniref:Uncharacterized protein n=1 Tax=Zingiber officinale TaxID=94328 RepID=A0A8J5KC19_ZINOF|nr:hypothetical protein ZIOFF_057766 [Zingiber officinale]
MVPTQGQFLVFDESGFVRNPELCAPQLRLPCTAEKLDEEEGAEGLTEDMEDDDVSEAGLHGGGRDGLHEGGKRDQERWRWDRVEG